MKKRMGYILAFCMVLSIAACGSTDADGGQTDGRTGRAAVQAEAAIFPRHPWKVPAENPGKQ